MEKMLLNIKKISSKWRELKKISGLGMRQKSDISERRSKG